MKRGSVLYIVFFVVLSVQAFSQRRPSVLSTGEWLKFSVAREGFYKITYDQVKTAGLNPDAWVPNQIKLYGYPNGMLPQLNKTPRPNDLVAVSIWVEGASDGKFNNGDYILFFGQNADKFFYNPKKNMYEYENNIYSDLNYYFLSGSDGLGAQITSQESLSGTFSIVNQYDDFVFYENDKTNKIYSGRMWVGEDFTSSTSLTFNSSVPGILQADSKFVSQIVGASYNSSSMDILINGNKIGNQAPTNLIRPTKFNQFPPWGSLKNDTLEVSASAVASSSTQAVKYQFNKAASDYSTAFLDFFIWSFKRTLALYDDQTVFTSSQALDKTTCTYQVANVSSDYVLWDVTDPFNCLQQKATLTTNTLQFSVTGGLKRFAIATLSKVPTATFVAAVPNQDVYNSTPACDYLIITHPTLLEQANRLATFRIGQGISTQVVTVDKLYNEFAGGRKDITAIRDFIRSQYLSYNKLKYVLFFGTASYDYRDILRGNINLVPNYQSRESIDPTASYASDDYFGFMDDDEGTWIEVYPTDTEALKKIVEPKLEFGLGRIPARNATEAQNVVDKLILYDSDKTYGDWRNQVMFMADDGEAKNEVPLHMNDANRLATYIETKQKKMQVSRVFIDEFNQVTTASSQSCPDMTDEVTRRVKQGVGIINYTGHGNEQQLAVEDIIDMAWVKALSNAPHFPLFVNATCDFGRNDDPIYVSSGQYLITMKNAGAIGMVCSQRLVLSSTNYLLNEAFYRSLFTKSNGRYRRLGDIFRDAKNNSIARINNRNYIYLGDPTMYPPFAQDSVAVTAVSPANTWKGLSTVTISGDVKRNGITNTTMNGKIDYALYDRPLSVTTKGDENDPFTFEEFRTVLVKGTTNVVNGKYTINATLPAYFQTTPFVGSLPDSLKLTLYAYNDSQQYAGYYYHKPLSEVATIQPDNTPPLVKLYINDASFSSNIPVGKNSTLMADISDTGSGINLSTFRYKYTLRDSLVYPDNTSKVMPLVKYYEASTTDPQHAGSVSFNHYNLAEGTYKSFVTVSDLLGNLTTQSIQFTVSNETRIDNFKVYPNPWNNQSSDVLNFSFINNQPGSSLSASLIVYDAIGSQLITQEISVQDSAYEVKIASWDGTSGGQKVQPGIYFARLTVTSSAGTTSNTARIAIMN